MKSKLVYFLLFLGAATAFAITFHNAQDLTIPTAIAANATNATPQTAYTFSQDYPALYGKLYLTGSGIAATTNGSLKVYIDLAYDTNTFTTSTLTFNYLTMTTLGAATNTIDAKIDLRGVKSIRVGRVENTFSGAVSNLALHLEAIQEKD